MKRNSGPSTTTVFLLMVLATSALHLMEARRPERGIALRSWASLLARPTLNVGLFLTRTLDHLHDFRKSREDFEAQVAYLEAENRRLRQLTSTFDEVYEEQVRLQCLLDLHETHTSSVPARVIGRMGNSWYRNLLINKGSRDGVIQDAAVITADGVVGQIIEVQPRTATVQLILNEMAGVACVVENSRTQGIFLGQGHRPGRLRFYRMQREDLAGKRVATSGLDGVYPKGIPLGEIYDCEFDARGEVLEAKVKPAVDFDRLEELLVVIPGKDDYDATLDVPAQPLVATAAETHAPAPKPAVTPAAAATKPPTAPKPKPDTKKNPAGGAPSAAAKPKVPKPDESSEVQEHVATAR